MPASPFVKEVDGIQKALKTSLKDHEFLVRGRTFNRATSDGLVQVINLQMGPSDPPGTTYIPGLRSNLHGLFTINLGVYIPEVAEIHGGGLAKAWVQEYSCSIRARLGRDMNEAKDIWWPAKNERNIVFDIHSLLMSSGLEFLERFSSRDKILTELEGHGANLNYCAVPRIISAIIFAKRGQIETARDLMSAQTKETLNPNHPTYVRELAKRMGLGGV